MPSCAKPAPGSRNAVLDAPTLKRKERKGIVTMLETTKTGRIAQHMQQTVKGGGGLLARKVTNGRTSEVPSYGWAHSVTLGRNCDRQGLSRERCLLKEGGERMGCARHGWAQLHLLVLNSAIVGLSSAEVLRGATFGTNANATMGAGQGVKVKK
eukprot:2178584-Rhodomonas_salina.1